MDRTTRHTDAPTHARDQLISLKNRELAELKERIREMEEENEILKRESEKDFYILNRAAHYLNTGQDAQLIADFIICRLKFKSACGLDAGASGIRYEDYLKEARV